MLFLIQTLNSFFVYAILNKSYSVTNYYHKNNAETAAAFQKIMLQIRLRNYCALKHFLDCTFFTNLFETAVVLRLDNLFTEII